MFSAYSHKGCQFECKLTKAFNTIGCIPWDYPVPPSIVKGQGEEVRICNAGPGGNLLKFEAFMDGAESVRGCKCQPDCEEIAFETQVSTTFHFSLGNYVMLLMFNFY